MKTSELTKHKWLSILSTFGLDERHLTGMHTSCPVCGGNDRFRFDDKRGRGTYFCNQCGAGDGFDLLMRFKGWSFKKTASEIDSVVSSLSSRPFAKTNNIPDKLARLKKQRSRMKLIHPKDGVSNYLRNRGISQTTINKITRSLQMIRKLEYWQDYEIQGRYDAMVALVCVHNEILTHHVTYLENGYKANLSAPKKLMPAPKSTSGGAVQLFSHDKVLAITEGIETALAVTDLYNLPAWAALSANNLRNFKVPNGVEELHIFSDNDQNYVGQLAATELANITAKSGIETHLHIPTTVGNDWNDELIGLRGKHVKI